MRYLKFILISALFLFEASGCSNASNMQADLFSLGNYLKTPAEVNQILRDGNVDDLQILDVRTSEEFKLGCLPGAKNMDVQSGEFSSHISSLDKNG